MIKVLAPLYLIAAFGAVGAMDLADARGGATPEEIRRARASYPLGERRTPAPLADCRPEDVISISQNSASEVPWQAFCSSSYSIRINPKKRTR